MCVFRSIALAIVIGGTFAMTAMASDDTRALVPPYQNCVRTKALALEPSGADAPDLIAAAITACKDAREKLATSIYIDFLIEDQRKGTKSSPSETEYTLTEVDRRISSQVLLAVLEQRAKRKTR